MANSCSVTCNVRNSEGRVVVSELWKDLLTYLNGDRRKALINYFTATNSDFLARHAAMLDFDANGEPTFESLREEIGEDLLNNKDAYFRKNLQYSDALNTVIVYNQKAYKVKQGKKDTKYMATLEARKDGKYDVKIVERTPEAEYDLANHIQNRVVTSVIKETLQNAGVKFDFVDDVSYSMMYKETPGDTFYAITQLLDGVTTSSTAAEAAGHFIASMLDGNPLVERLKNMLTPEVQTRIFRDEKSPLYRKDFIPSEGSRREAAGILIGNGILQMVQKAQLGTLDKLAAFIPKTLRGIVGIIPKIYRFVKKIFGKYKPDIVKKAQENAYKQAQAIAKGYMGQELSAPIVIGGLQTGTTYVSGGLSRKIADNVQKNRAAYISALETVKNTVDTLKPILKGIGASTNRDILNKLKAVVDAGKKDMSALNLPLVANRTALRGIVNTLTQVSNILRGDVLSLIDSIQPSDKLDPMANLGTNAHSMREVNEVVKAIAQIYQSMSDTYNSLIVDESAIEATEEEREHMGAIKEALNAIGQVLNGSEDGGSLIQLLREKNKMLFIDTMSAFYGQDFIEWNAGIVFHGGKLVKDPRNGTRIPISDLVTELSEDIGIWDRFMSSASDCGDFVTANGSRIVKAANLAADRLAGEVWGRLEENRMQMQELFGNTNWTPFLETMLNEDGMEVKTGNFISELNRGLWESDYEKFRKELNAAFKEHLQEKIQEAKDKYGTGYDFALTDLQKGLIWEDFIKDKWEKWHEEHSDTTKDGRHIPKASLYKNEKYAAIFGEPGKERTPEQKRRLKWYTDFINIKKDLDGLLDPGDTYRFRVPQFTGSFYHMAKNVAAKTKSNMHGIGSAIRRKAANLFRIKEDESWMFGSDNTFNDISDNPFGIDPFFEKEKPDRIPKYGINKLKDMDNLSTDVYGSMLRYASMAATYKSIKDVADIFEIGAEVIKNRKYKPTGLMAKFSRKGEPRATTRYFKFVEKDVYGLNITPPKNELTKVVRKVISRLASFGTRSLLAGNVHGGVVNTGTGVFEVLKEAWANENYDTGELNGAIKMYFENIAPTIASGILDMQRPQDFNSLWIRHWNILSENRAFLHNQMYDVSLINNRLWEWFGHSCMLPYSSGEHLMQTLPYYAMGLHQKVYRPAQYKKDGETYNHKHISESANGNVEAGDWISLMDAYEIVDGQEVRSIVDEEGYSEKLGERPKKIKLKDGVFISREKYDNYKRAMRFVNMAADYKANHPDIKPTSELTMDNFSREDVEFLQELNIKTPTNYRELVRLKDRMATYAESQKFGLADESAFMDKCRNICNRLHGIYNTEDRVAFQQDYYINLAMAMRGYVLGMVNRRYSGSKFNVPQKQNVEGNMDTFLKVLLRSTWEIFAEGGGLENMSPLLFMVPILNGYTLWSDSFGARVKSDMMKAGFSPNQYFNMRRTGADYAILELLWLGRLLSSPGMHIGADDDKKKKEDVHWAWQFMYYFCSRWLNEEGAFNWPSRFFVEGNQFLDWMPAGLSGMRMWLDILGLLSQWGWDSAFDTDKERKGKAYYQKNDAKYGNYSKKDPKAIMKFKKIIPFVRSYYIFQPGGYKAYENLEYGRRLKGR